MVVACSSFKVEMQFLGYALLGQKDSVIEQHRQNKLNITTNKNNDKHLKESNTGQALLQDSWFLSTLLVGNSKSLNAAIHFTSAGSSLYFLKTQPFPNAVRKNIIKHLKGVIRAQGESNCCHWRASEAPSLAWTSRNTVCLAECPARD